MIYGFKSQGQYDVPSWANKLKNLYWMIRAEPRNKSKKRKYYRWISKEKLRLAEKGINQDAINAVCKYLSKLTVKSGESMQGVIYKCQAQLNLLF